MPVLPFDVNTAIELGEFVADAYSIYRAADPATFVLSNPGYKIVHRLYADDLFDGIPGYVLFGFIARSTDGNDDNKDVVVAIRGTIELFEWLKDADFFMSPCPAGPQAGKTEQGFTDLYNSLRIDANGTALTAREALEQMKTSGELTTLRISGHSLGSSIATILALDVRVRSEFDEPTLYTFASPLVGDKTFAGYFDSKFPNSKRVANSPDIVPHLPPTIIGFSHVDTLYPINSDDSTKNSIICHHSLQTYLHTLRQSVPLSPDCVPVAGA